MDWPPREEDFQSIATSAISNGPDMFDTVLVYADNPGIMIFDPVLLGPSPCIRRYVTIPESYRKFVVIISEQD